MLVHTVDTDAVVLTVIVIQAFGAGKSLAAYRMSSCLGPEKSLHSWKENCMDHLEMPELTGALLILVHAPTGIPEECMQAIERFVILIYD